MYQCTSHKVKVINPQGAHLNDNVINMSQAPGNVGTTVQWSTNNTNNTGIAYLYGRESIGSLALKLKQTQADSSKYVLQSETTTTSEANKVVRLGGDGKINANMMPSIAIGEYFEISEFTDDALRRLNHYENGDTVVVTSGTDKGSKYFCINKGAAGALTGAFIKLNDKNGLVTSVNDATGAVTLKIEATTDKLQLKVNDEMKSEVEIISDTDIDTIINGLS